MKYFALLLFAITSIIYPHAADSSRTIIAVRLESPLKIDGILDEPLYKTTPVDNFTQQEPNEGVAASEKTKIWIGYDDSNIYFCGKFYDPHPDSIDKSLMRRDNLIESDWIWIYMDPYNDNWTGYYFAVNAGGSICDGTLYNDGWMDDTWDGIWEVKTSIDSEGWKAEMRIPFSQLRFKESEKMIWGINLNRDIKRRHEMAFYIMVPKTESGFISKFADLAGLNGIKPKQRIEFLPYVVQKAKYLHGMEGDPFYKSNQYKTSFGADLKFGIGSNLNVDATFNPDFGQVEVDPAIVNLTAFENYYSEKRPFFIEGNKIFEFGTGGANNTWGFGFGLPKLYYSRRIGRSPQGMPYTPGTADIPGETRIIGAGKLSGKLDESWSVGLLSATTERTYAKVQSLNSGIVENEIEPLTHYGVLRTRKEFDNGNSALGMIFTSVNRDLQDPAMSQLLTKGAYTFGLDGWSFLDANKVYVLTGTVVGSYVDGTKESLWRVQKQPYRYFQRPDKTYMPFDSSRTSLSGMYARFMLNKQEGNFYLNAALGTASPGFEHNDLGYQSYADKINGHILTGYRWYEPDNLFRRKSIYLGYSRTMDYEDNVTKSGFYFNGSLRFVNFWNVSLEAKYDFESVSTTLTRGGPKVLQPANYYLSLITSTDANKKIVISPSVGYTEDKSGGYSSYAGIAMDWKPESQIMISIGTDYEFVHSVYQWVGSVTDAAASATYGKRYLFSDMDQRTLSANIRLNWTFTPTLSLQIYLQPLFSVGQYSRFKELAEPNSMNYRIYGEEGTKIIYDENSGQYSVNPDQSNQSDSFSFWNPDFNYKSLRGNLVLRWEVRPGSVLYAVWTHDKTNFFNPGDFSLGRDFSDLWREPADNIFLLKFSYWFDI